MKRRIIMLGMLVVLLLSSCASRKNVVYLQDMKIGEEYSFDARYEPIIRRNDRLSITVSNKNPELAIPFNIYNGSFKINSLGDVDTDIPNRVNEKGYRVDADGDIDFPIIGVIHAEGLKISELKDVIKEKIEEGNYMRDPLVSIEFLNFRYTVLGAVGRNGTFTVDGDRITLLEAIANAGDLSANAKTDRVAVIREVDGKRKMYMHDLRSMDVFKSPCFYLQQNDLVYVEPKYKQRDNEERGWRIATTLLSLVSAITTIFWVLK